MKGWKFDSHRHMLSSKGIKSSYLAKRTLYHGTPVRNIPSIRSEGLKPVHGELWGTTDPETAREYAEQLRRFDESDKQKLEELSENKQFMRDFMHARFPHDRNWNPDSEFVDGVYLDTWRRRIERADYGHIDKNAVEAMESLQDKYPEIKDIKGLKSSRGSLVRYNVDIPDDELKEQEETFSKSFVVGKEVPPEKLKIFSPEEANVIYAKEQAKGWRRYTKKSNPEEYEVPEGMFAKKVDLKRYAGTWKQTSIKNEPWFQKGLTNVKAKYSVQKDGTVKVVNTGKGLFGNVKIVGTARSVSKDNRHLKVKFPLAPEGDYKIKKLDNNYTRVTVKGGKTTWELEKIR